MSPEPATSQKSLPAYLRLAGLLRADIASGRFAPGAKLPSETQLMMRQRVSRAVAKWAIAVLKAEGLVEGRQGAGVFVREPRRLTRRVEFGSVAGIRHQRGPGQLEPVIMRSEVVGADAAIAERLAIEPGDMVLRSTSHVSHEMPVQLVHSWQPLRSSSEPRQAVLVRERLIIRSASPDEIVALALPARGGWVFAIARVASARDGRPIETADIVIAADRCELVYECSRAPVIAQFRSPNVANPGTVADRPRGDH